MTHGGAIGFHCRHLYEEGTLSNSEKKLQAKAGAVKPVSARALKLKNEDAVVAIAATSFGLQVIAAQGGPVLLVWDKSLKKML